MPWLGDFTEGGTLPPCWQKRRYETLEEADARRETLSAFGGFGAHTVPSLLEAYACRHCGGFHLGHNRQKELNMDDVATRPILADGGKVTLLLGRGFDVPTDYALHPQVIAVMADSLRPEEVSGRLNSNTRAVILTDRINQPTYLKIKNELSRRKLLYLERRTPEAIKRTLDDIFEQAKRTGVVLETARPAPPVAAAATLPASDNGTHGKEEDDVKRRTIAPRGAISTFVAEEADLSKGTADEARRLFKLAKERGLETTPGSIEQGIARAKRQRGRSGEPAVAVPPHLEALRVLDDTIAGLTLLRDFIEQTVEMRADLDAKQAKIREAMKALL